LSRHLESFIWSPWNSGEIWIISWLLHNFLRLEWWGRSIVCRNDFLLIFCSFTNMKVLQICNIFAFRPLSQMPSKWGTSQKPELNVWNYLNRDSLFPHRISIIEYFLVPGIVHSFFFFLQPVFFLGVTYILLVDSKIRKISQSKYSYSDFSGTQSSGVNAWQHNLFYPS
jgi:hypothetical protein